MAGRRGPVGDRRPVLRRRGRVAGAVADPRPLQDGPARDPPAPVAGPLARHRPDRPGHLFAHRAGDPAVARHRARRHGAEHGRGHPARRLGRPVGAARRRRDRTLPRRAVRLSTAVPRAAPGHRVRHQRDDRDRRGRDRHGPGLCPDDPRAGAGRGGGGGGGRRARGGGGGRRGRRARGAGRSRPRGCWGTRRHAWSGSTSSPMPCGR